jgi:SAM-dependent methyltransferase
MFFFLKKLYIIQILQTKQNYKKMSDSDYKINYKGNNYSKFRPSYSDKLFSIIYDFHQTGFDLAIDDGTGTGQVASVLADKFKQVVGIDYLPQMVESAIKRDNITYKVGKAEDLSAFQDNSVDMITSATAFHWFDHDAFFKEAKRVLKPSGTLAIFSYYYGLIKDNDEASSIVSAANNKLHEHYVDEKIKYIENLYRDIQFPFDEQYWYITPKKLDTANISRPVDGSLLEATMTVQKFNDYMKTSSAYTNFSKTLKDSDVDPTDTMAEDIMKVLNLTYKEQTLQVE